MYCFKCKRSTDTHSVRTKITKNSRTQRCGNCAVCGTKKSQFIKGAGLVNGFINNLPFEMHYPGHSFLGPGTKLNERLNEDLTPKGWSLPIDEDDKVAYKHDLCYLKNKDGKTRNAVCDEAMLNDLTAILNPSASEKKHIAIAKTIIGTKKRFGLGIKKKKHLLDRSVSR